MTPPYEWRPVKQQFFGLLQMGGSPLFISESSAKGLSG